MKKKISLVKLSKNELKDARGSALSACEACFWMGVTEPVFSIEESSQGCFCGCYYDGEPGGSCYTDNRAANIAGGLVSPPRD